MLLFQVDSGTELDSPDEAEEDPANKDEAEKKDD